MKQYKESIQQIQTSIQKKLSAGTHVVIVGDNSVGQDTKAVVVIDEVDKYLSPLYTARIFPYLQERFPCYTFCVTTHARDLLKYASDYILCPLM